jgi:hypothetical protein
VCQQRIRYDASACLLDLFACRHEGQTSHNLRCNGKVGAQWKLVREVSRSRAKIGT